MADCVVCFDANLKDTSPVLLEEHEISFLGLLQNNCVSNLKKTCNNNLIVII